ncbi:MAG: hypothetical protein ACREJ0_21390, partial [Geminicoccaceae bacterium]
MPDPLEQGPGSCQKRGRAADHRRRTLGERAQLPIEPLQFGIAFGKQRREPVALADQLLYPARAFFEGWLELLATSASLEDFLRQSSEPVRERRDAVAVRGCRSFEPLIGFRGQTR